MNSGSSEIAGLNESIESLRAELASCRRELAEHRQRADQANRSGETEADKRQCLLATLESAQIGLWEGEIKNFALAEVWSPRFREIFGVSLEAEASQELFLKCIHPEDRKDVERAVLEAVSGAVGGRYRAEYRIVKPADGSVRWVKASGQAFLSRDGKVDRLIGAVLDVTDGKQLEEEKVRLQAEFSDLFEEAPIPYVHEGVDTRFIRANRAARKLLGIEAGEVGDTSGSSLVADTPENERRRQESLSRAGTGREFGPVLLELRRPDNGAPVWVHRWSRPAPDGNYTRTMYWDVTDWVRMEQTKAALESTLESGQVGDWEWDLERDAFRRSLRHDQCFGYSRPIPESEWSVNRFFQHVHPEDRTRVEEEVREAIEVSEYWKSEFRVVWPDGSLHWIAARGSTDRTSEGKATRLLGLVMDITDRKRTEEALRASEQLARGQVEALRQTLDALAKESDPDRLVEHVLRTVAAQLGAHSCSVWRRGATSGQIHFEHSFEDGRLLNKSDAVLRGIDLSLPTENFRPWSEVFRTGKPGLLQDIRELPFFPWQTRLISLGVITVLIVPMAIAGHVEAAIGVRFTAKRLLTSEELDLAQALANQAMLAMQLTRLSAQSRESAVIIERNRSAEALQASEKLARGQVEALKKTLDALAREATPDRLVGHIMHTITEQFGAHSSSVWRRDSARGRVVFEFAFEDGRVVTKTDPRFSRMDLQLPMEDSWPWPEVFRTGKVSVIEDIRSVPPFPLRDRLLPLGIITVLFIPMTIAGRLEGAIALRFKQKRGFRTEEIELAQALANQAMLAMELNRLSVESRESAVISERNRMARDIHDTLAQGFTGVIVQLEAAKGAAAKGDAPTAAKRVEQASELARSSLGEARRSVRALRPGSLCDGTLLTALDGLLKQMADGTKLRAELRIVGEPQPIVPAWEETLLRITQESLTNTIKHSGARTFEAVLSFQPARIQLRLVDDGLGFEPGGETDGFGLIGMRERVTEIGGRFVLRSSPGAGVEILVTLGANDHAGSSLSHAAQ